MAALKLVSTLLVICILVTAPMSHAISCQQVTTSLVPCIRYLTGVEVVPSGQCCNGVKSLNAAAKTTPDRQVACNCLKQIAGKISGINYQVAGGLPGKCGVNIPYKISPSTDCSKIK